MPDIVLINPPVSQEDRYGKLAPFGNHLPNLGLAYLAAFLREKGVGVSIIDASAEELSVEKTARLAADRLPLIAGLTATTLSIGRAAAVAAKIKQFAPDTHILLGGPHLTSVPEETMATYRSIDIGVIGEGEATLLDVFRRLSTGRPVNDVEGLILRDKGELVRTQPRALIPNLDSLPMPAWDLLPSLPEHYRPSMQSFARLPSTVLCTSRGCPWRCAFCDRSVFGRKYRSHSPRRVFEMVVHLQQTYGIRDISFHDEMFFVDEKKVVELCQHITRNNLDLTWSCQTRADLPISEFGLRMMKEAGCWQIQFGLESGSEAMLRRMQKDLTTEEIRRAFTRTVESGIRTKAFVMLGFPGETAETLAETERFILDSDLQDVMIGFFTPFPGIEARSTLDQFGKIIENYDKFSDHFVAYLPEGLTVEDLQKARNRMYRHFYVRPKMIRNNLARLRDPSARPGLLLAARRFWGATR